MFFIIQDVVDYFDMLDYGPGLFLEFLAVDFCLSHWLHGVESSVPN